MLSFFKEIKVISPLIPYASYAISHRTRNTTIYLEALGQKFFIKVGGPAMEVEYSFVSWAWEKGLSYVPQPVEYRVVADTHDAAPMHVAVYAHESVQVLTARTAERHLIATVDAIADWTILASRERRTNHGMLQHCDMSFYNIGCGRRGIVIFDWEDVRIVDNADLDFSVFIASVLGFKPERILTEYIQDSAAPARQALVHYAERVGKSVTSITAHISESIQAFAALKRELGYAADLVEALDRLADTLEEEWPAHPVTA